MNLKVPFAEKDEAKKLGARWDAARKIWYVVSDGELAAFARWSPTPQEASGLGEPGPKAAAAKAQVERGKVEAGKLYEGADYRPQARVCQCLPWEVCDKCRSTALNN
jgi:hypothetical protein